MLAFWPAGDGGLGANGTLVVRGDEMLLLSSSSGGAPLSSAGRTSKSLLELATPRSAKVAFVPAGARARDDEPDEDEGEVDVGELG